MAVVLVIGLLPSAAFAAEGDSPIVVSTADKTNVKPGEKLTITYTLAHDLDYMTALDIVLRYDATLFQFVSTDIDGSVWFDNPTQNGAYGADSQALVRIRQYNDDNEETIAAGKICSVTFASLDNISGAQTAFFFNGTTGISRSSIEVDEETLYVKDGAFNHGESDPIKVTITPDGAGPIPTATGYTVSMGADQQVAAGQQVRIPVTVASGEKGITGFNAYDMTFTYDPTALTLNTKTGDAANLTVEDNNGTVRVRRYGAPLALGEALALDFTAKATATSTVKLTNAKFDLDANSINFDAPEATISDADTVVNANNFTVTLPDAFTSDETRLVPNGGSFTFKPVDSHYTYTFTVKMGDSAKEGLTFGANDTYTIANISGNVEVTCTGKTPKQYDVKYKIDEDVEQDVTKGPETVTYLNDYSFVVTPRAGYSYRVVYSVDNGDPFVHTVIAVPTANDDGTLTYTIPGKEIVGGVEIWIDANTESGIPVVFTGNGVEDAASGNASSMGKNMPYYFTLNQRESCDYTVTAYYQPLASSTASKRPATVRSLGNGKYVVEAVNYNDYLYVYAHSWNLVVKVEKVSHSAEEVTVSKYLELNDKTMMLVTVKGTPEGGSAFTYDGNTMYKVEGYGTDRYAWLVIVDKGQTLTQEEAAAKVAISAADNVVTITPSFDVNRTGKVDVNDAQLVYDMYNGTYSNFTQVSVEKFLRADVNATKVVDHTDAVAIVNQFK
ncbi:MAG: cohesin domain-containing protein [Oscillospiraceae bacterium]